MLALLLDPSSLLASARTSRRHLHLARQVHPTFFATPPSLLCLPDEILHLISNDIARARNRALALTCRRLLPIARAHTWFQAPATKQDTSRMLTQIKAKRFRGELLRRLAFEAMDAACPDDPPPLVEFLIFVKLVPYLSNLNQLAIYTLPKASHRVVQEAVLNALFKLDNLVELELGGWDVEDCWNPPLRVELLYPLIPHLNSLQSLSAIVQGRDHWEQFEVPPEIVACRATDVRIRFDAPATDEELFLLAQHTFPNVLTLSLDLRGSFSTPGLLAALAFATPSLFTLCLTGITFPGTYLDELRSPLLRHFSLRVEAATYAVVPHLPPHLEILVIDTLNVLPYDLPGEEPRFFVAFLERLRTKPEFLHELDTLVVMCRKEVEDYVRERTQEAMVGRVVELSVLTGAPLARCVPHSVQVVIRALMIALALCS